MPLKGTSVPGQTRTANYSFVLCGTQEGATDMEIVTNSSKNTGRFLCPLEFSIPPETTHFLKQEAKKKEWKTKQKPQDICMRTHFRGFQSKSLCLQWMLLHQRIPACQSGLRVPQLSPCFSHQLFAHLSFQRWKCESFPISVHYFYIKVITNPVFVSNMCNILVLTLRHPGCMISLQMEHSISMRLNLLSSSSTVSSFPASPHTKHTAVWGNTGCLHTWESSLDQDTEDIWKQKNSNVHLQYPHSKEEINRD